MSVDLVILKHIGNQCNMSCEYCYAKKISSNCANSMIMSDDILRKVFFAFSLSDHIPIFFWGGGEPLIAGTEFFERVLKLQSEYFSGKSAINSLQTNGLLLDEKWLNFFKQNNFQIGISWDGPNSARVTNGGNDTSEKVWDIIEECVENGLRFGIISVITKKNIDRLGQIAKSLYCLGIKSLFFKPYFGDIKDLSINPLDYTKGVCELLDLWIEADDPNWILEPVYSFVGVLNGDLSSVACSVANGCGNFLAIEHDGMITCCDFVPNKISFGNIREYGTIEDLYISSTYRGFTQNILRKPKKCLNCGWNYLCGGGCLHYRKFKNGYWGEYILCEATQHIASYFKRKLKL